MKIPKHLSPLLKKVEEHRNNISKERDALRLIQNEIEDILEGVDRGTESLDIALDAFKEIEHAVDSLSERL